MFLFFVFSRVSWCSFLLTYYDYDMEQSPLQRLVVLLCFFLSVAPPAPRGLVLFLSFVLSRGAWCPFLFTYNYDMEPSAPPAPPRCQLVSFPPALLPPPAPRDINWFLLAAFCFWLVTCDLRQSRPRAVSLQRLQVSLQSLQDLQSSRLCAHVCVCEREGAVFPPEPRVCSKRSL